MSDMRDDEDVLLWDPEEHPRLSKWLDERLRERGFDHSPRYVPVLTGPTIFAIDSKGVVSFVPLRR